MNGIILLHKPAGITSFQALGAVKRKLATGKVGHAGTLDRFAAGLLIAAVGKFTRLIRLFTAEEKEYRATVVFGKGTDTLDPEGEPTGTGPVPARSELEAALPGFRGVIRQRPPVFSAVRVAGVRAHRYARQGRAPELAEREVRIETLRLEEYRPPRAVIGVVCSKGTYIRALARDIAVALGTQAHLETLVRTRIGQFTLAEAVSPDEFDPARDLLGPDAFVGRIAGLGRVSLVPGKKGHILAGRKLEPALFRPPPDPGWNAVFDPAGDLLAIVDRQEGKISYVMVLKD
jgi:tRNA pseudouridine55 synthase